MGKIVLEDFYEGNGHYKVNLAYLNKEQVKEIESLVSKWKPTDEYIKSCIEMCLTDANEQRFKDYGTNLKDCLDWLEKQSNTSNKSTYTQEVEVGNDNIKALVTEEIPIDKVEPNPYSGVSFKYNGHTWGMCARDGGVEIAMDGNLKAFILSDKPFVYPTNPIPNIKPKSALDAVKEEKIDNSNKVEPKVKGSNYVVDDCGYLWNIDKAEPKFKIRDWITNGRYTHLVVGVDSRHYQFKNGDAKYIDDINRKYHLWTIQDAKNGDILVDKYNNIGIFQECEGICWHSYIYLGCDGELRGFSIGGSHEKTATHPATKEQRYQLEKAMTDAGYTFDFKKKKLEKIEQKPQRIISAEAKEALYNKSLE